MRLAWATDIHLNFVDEAAAVRFCERIKATEAQALLLGGDIAESHDLETWLQFLVTQLQRPVYFVLGNHDYYGSSIAAVRQQITVLDSPGLYWLPNAALVELTSVTALVAHDGWADARIGQFLNSQRLPGDGNSYSPMIQFSVCRNPCHSAITRAITR